MCPGVYICKFVGAICQLDCSVGVCIDRPRETFFNINIGLIEVLNAAQC